MLSHFLFIYAFLSSAKSLTETHVESLIRHLATVNKPGPGYGVEFPFGRNGIQFLPEPDVERVGEHVTKVQIGAVAPALLELIKIGRPALPALLDHLSDSTSTQTLIPVRNPTWIGTERDPRIRSPLGQRIWSTMPNDWGMFDHYGEKKFGGSKYNVRVGDLCAIAVGQIVGRDLELISESPREARLTSPLVSPQIAIDIKNDWNELSETEHIKSLEFDVLHTRLPYLAPEPFKRLLSYYPNEATRFAATLLSRPIATLDSGGGISNWLSSEYTPDPFENLVHSIRPDLWMKVAAVDLSSWLLNSNPRAHAFALRIQKRLFPDLDPRHPSLVEFTDPGDVLEIVNETMKTPSDNLDKAIDSAFRKAVALPFEGYGDNDVLDDLAIASVERLSSKGYIEPYRTYLHKRANQLTPLPRYSTVPLRREELQRWAQVLDLRKLQLLNSQLRPTTP